MYISYTKLLQKINDLKFELTSINYEVKKLRERISILEKNFKEK